jgi:hypothetical protein
MLRPLTFLRRRPGRLTVDERAGAVCDAVCHAVTRRERDLVTALQRRGSP